MTKFPSPSLLPMTDDEPTTNPLINYFENINVADKITHEDKQMLVVFATTINDFPPNGCTAEVVKNLSLFLEVDDAETLYSFSIIFVYLVGKLPQLVKEMADSKDSKFMNLLKQKKNSPFGVIQKNIDLILTAMASL